ncbi:MAG: hypothetical protein KGJ60_02050 [Verrucomicrobiota bacterium]|nr:hypothetical protein [Verrucomicrobiota bacterium]
MNTVKTCLAAALLCAAITPALSAAPPDLWTWRNPAPTGNPLNSVVHGLVNGNGLFVAVGQNGAIVTSPDGVNWEQQIAPANANLAAVTWGAPNGSAAFVAVGVDAVSLATNEILTSPDGAHWTSVAQSLGAGGGLLAVAYGNNEFLAVGSSGANWFSKDGGANWTPGGATLNTNLNGVAYGGGQFVAVGDGGTILTSPDGSAWAGGQINVNGSPVTENFAGIGYGNGTFVAVGPSPFYYSSDGVTWNRQTTVNGYWGDSVLYANGKFIVANTVTYYPSLVTSPDGMAWTNYDEPPWLFASIAADGSGTYVGVGPGVIATNATDITVAADWGNVVQSVSSGQLNAVAYGTTTGGTNLFLVSQGGYFGEATLLTSTNGYNWQETNYTQLYNSFITGLAWGKSSSGTNVFVATVNASAGFLGSNSVIMSSSDGAAWTISFGTPSGSGSILNGIAYGTTSAGTPKFVAVGTQGTIATSSNLTSWVTNSVAASSLIAVAGGNGRFVAVGSFGVTATSTDGISWTTNSDGDANQENLNGVAFGGGQFVAAGSGGVIFTSPDGSHWSSETSGTSDNLNSVAYGAGLFVAGSANGGILVSTHGVEWTQSASGTANNLAAVGFGDNQFVAVGDSGAILGSVLAAVSGASYNAGTGVFTFAVSGPPGTYGVYVSRDLMTWTWLQNVTFTANNPTQTLTDLTANYSQGYYSLGPPGP